MPLSVTTDTNTTVTLEMINGLDMGMSTQVQKMLAPLYENFPSLANTFWGIPYANLIAATATFFLFLFLRKLFTAIIIVPLQQLAKKTTTYYDDRIISALKDPLRFSFILIGTHLFFQLIFKETQTIQKILETLVVYTVFWTFLSIAEALKGILYNVTSQFNPDLSKETGNFILTILKILIAAVGLGAMLQVWGINVTALIASLGIGGLAFALAAKDTVANLFGSFSLLADRTIRIGEWIKVNGVEGIVEDIGMRTTKIRSFEKSLIMLPNYLIANNPVENFSRRGVRRIKTNIGLTYSTTTLQVETIVSQIRDMLKSHERIAQNETILVSFDEFSESALNIFIYAFTTTSNWEHYLQIREDVHLKIMKIVEENGSAFAFPSQSVYIEQMPKNTANEQYIHNNTQAK